MKNIRRILALTGVIIIGLLYVLCIIFAIIGSEFTQGLLMAAIMLTILIPIVVHFISVALKNTEVDLGPDESETEE